MNIALWIAQIFLGVSFLLEGIKKLSPPPGLPEFAQWLYDLPPTVSALIGIAELAAAAGLILPGLLKKRPDLTSWAALGLVVNMAGAIVFHVMRAEHANLTLNVTLLLIAAFVAWGRWKTWPLPSNRTPKAADDRVKL